MDAYGEFSGVALSKEEIEAHRQTYSLLDPKGTGIPSFLVKGVFKVLGATDEEVNDLLAFANPDGNATVSFTEYINVMAVKTTNSADIEEAVREAFGIFDKDGHGFMTTEDLRFKLTEALSREKEMVYDKLIEEELDEMIKEADVDGDGYINYENFVKFILQ